jgi:hypothetical protein
MLWGRTQSLGLRVYYWLIDYLLFYVPLRIFHLHKRRHHCRWRAAKFRPMLGTQGLWAGKDLYRTTPTGTRDLGFSGLIRRTAPFSPLLRHAWGRGGSILTRILTGRVSDVKTYIIASEALSPRPWDLPLTLVSLMLRGRSRSHGLCCYEVFAYSTSNFSAIRRLSPLPVTGLQILAYAFEQGGIFIVPHLLRHGTSVYTISSERPAPMSHSGIRTPDVRIIRSFHQIIAPNALTTAPRRRLLKKMIQ